MKIRAIVEFEVKEADGILQYHKEQKMIQSAGITEEEFVKKVMSYELTKLVESEQYGLGEYGSSSVEVLSVK
jgi:hypothetical protein